MNNLRTLVLIIISIFSINCSKSFDTAGVTKTYLLYKILEESNGDIELVSFNLIKSEELSFRNYRTEFDGVIEFKTASWKSVFVKGGGIFGGEKYYEDMFSKFTTDETMPYPDYPNKHPHRRYYEVNERVKIHGTADISVNDGGKYDGVIREVKINTTGVIKPE